ncbi:MAG: IclR family transcriptional regulator [Burkholderiales bacterium]|nr:IclR family transcriptional regulator [Burkholderiales bacterium]
MPRAARRALDILEAFSRQHRPMTVSELAREIRVPMSTCHGLVKTLEGRGYLVETPRGGGYYPTRRMARLAADLERFDPLPAWLLARLTRLRDQCGETVLLARRVRDEAVYVEMIESNQSLRYIVKVGDRRPLHSSAVGKALLGALPEGEREALIDRLRLTRSTAATLSSREMLEADITRGVGRGWFATYGEYIAETGAIATFVVIDREDYAAVIAGPIERIRQRERRHVTALLALRREAAAAGEGGAR